MIPAERGKAGADSRQAVASLQRGWKTQPAGGFSGLGSSPGSTSCCACSAAGSGVGAASISARV